MTLLFCLLIFLPKILCSMALVHRLWEEWDLSSILVKFGIGIAIAMAISSSLFFIAMMIGVAPRMYSLVEFWGSLMIAGVLLFHSIPEIRKHWKFTKPVLQQYLSAAILLLGFGLMIFAFLFYARMHPYGYEDAWSIWNYLARFIYRTNSPDILVNSQYYQSFHPDYPAGLGLNVAWGWFIFGRENTNVPIAIEFYVIVAPALLLWGAIRKWRGILPATLATLVYMMNPNLEWSVAQMADGLLTVYMLSAVVVLYEYLHTANPKLLFLTGMLAGFSAWIKNEGILFVCVFLGIIAIPLFRRTINRNTLKWLAGGLAAPVLVIAIYKVVIRAPSDLFTSNPSVVARVLDAQRWLTISKAFFMSTLHYGNWPLSIVIVLLIYMLLIGFDRSERNFQAWLLLVILGQAAGYFAIYLITPYGLNWHLSLSIDRLISHLFLMLLFWMFAALRSPDFGVRNQESIVE